MKREVAFFKDRRGGFTAKNIIALYRSLGYSDEQIKEEMLKIKSQRQSDAATQTPYTPNAQKGETE